MRADAIETTSGAPMGRLVAQSPLRAPLLCTIAAVASLGLAVEVGAYRFDLAPAWVERFSLSYEANVPTWFATVLLFTCSLLLAEISAGEAAPRPWRLLSGLFAYMSLDEAIELHEYLGWLVHGKGVFYYGWIIPAGLIVALIAVSLLPFLRSLDRLTRARFVFAGAVYVGGALAMELPLGYWADAHGSDNLTYGLIDLVEESMELCGASFFVLALLDERKRRTA